MRKASPGVICVLLGVVLLLAALGLYGYNRWEDAQAGAEAQTVVQDLQEKVVEQTQSAASAPAIDYSSLDPELPVVELDGYEYVGTVSIPAIGIDLPVMSEWSYPKLKISPCRQFGSSRTDDLVIAAHNYESHFGKIGTLALGDEVRFTDMDGIENHYTVSAIEVHDPTDVEAVEHSGHDLVLCLVLAVALLPLHQMFDQHLWGNWYTSAWRYLPTVPHNVLLLAGAGFLAAAYWNKY